MVAISYHNFASKSFGGSYKCIIKVFFPMVGKEFEVLEICFFPGEACQGGIRQ